jgi:hypothetical protein
MTMDGQEEVLESVEQACQAIEATFGIGEESEEQAMMSAQKGYGPKNERPTAQQEAGDLRHATAGEPTTTGTGSRADLAQSTAPQPP